MDYLSIALPLGLLVNSAAVGVGGTLAAPSYVFLFSLITTACFIATGLYRQNWRFVSLADCSTLLLTVSSALCVAWVITLGIPELRRLGMALVPLAFTHFCIATTFMLGMRMLRRSAREFRLRWIGDPASSEECTSRRLILIGEPEWAVSVIQLTHANKSMHRNTPTTVMGVLLTRPEETITGLCGVPVLGSHTQLARSLELLSGKGQSPDSVVVCDDGVNLSEKDLLQVMRQVRELGLELVRIDDPWTKLLARQSAVDFDSLPITDLLGRSEINLTGDAVSRQVCGQSVLVTGAGGTIGGELVRQLAAFRPSRLVLVDHCEFNLYSVEMLLREAHPELVIVPELCNIRDASEVRHVFARHNPVIVYHAAALKHVPMVEANPCGGAHTNILGTKNIADAVCEFGVRAMVQVSTDKAVNPIGLMGATKRVGELYCQSLDFCGTDDPDSPRFMTVRFGNVLGSSGSVVPLFKRQLLEGRPLTITHPDIERFFMSVGEAVHLILQSSSHALEENATRGSIFVLDMGAPVKIIDLARRMIRLFGLEPDVDVPIQVVGLRPGEKLYEELFDSCEEEVQSGIVGLHEARSRPIPLPLITRAIDQLATAVRDSNQADVLQITHTLVKLPSSGVDMTSLYEKSPNTWRVSGPKLVAEA
ncbi:O-antigen biosynthesis protein WbqV [Novosphingobium hassiacum]|uniref:O-antigen biosynthesis protein WbqV n=1 Tax=Novosphingobium hassiacum TaxID=173676 RepID=A0A7W6A0M0_9SPHN|nr:nucleoside-diphosphate sugar epimerase/dehydratase [Novosphingobium hassiacum]MBB3862558.1 O-antigen biosynthesis protein WbqV [Novosphingobium hassiacum]